MKRPSRTNASAAEMRPRIIQAALNLIESEGFGSVTAPRLAKEIGLQRPIIYYYFKDIDEILVETIQSSYQTLKANAVREMEIKTSVEVLWQFYSIAAAPLSEFTAISLRNDRFKPVYLEIVKDFRNFMTVMIDDQRNEQGIPSELDTKGIALLLQIVSTALATEQRLGLSEGHAELKSYIDRLFINPFMAPAGRP